MRLGFDSPGLPGGLLLLFLSLSACVGDAPTDALYALAAGALGPEAHRDRAMVVNPRLLAPDNPRIPDRALAHLQAAGVEVLEGTGEESPEMATLYFTPPEEVGEGSFRLRVYVSLGARPGKMNRGDSWWLVLADCPVVCEVTEISPTDPPHRSSP